LVVEAESGVATRLIVVGGAPTVKAESKTMLVSTIGPLTPAVPEAAKDEGLTKEDWSPIGAKDPALVALAPTLIP